MAVETENYNPYLAARHAWDERYGDLLTRADNWRRIAALSGITALLAVGVLGWIVSQNHFTPFVVAVDALNNPIAAGYAGHTSPDQRAITAAIQNWIENVRVVTSDSQAQRRAIDLAYAHIASGSEAQAFVTEFHRANDPFARGRSETAAAEISSVLMTGERTYEVEWIETTRDSNGGLRSRERWKASVAIAISPPKDEKTARANPFGVYITNASWSRVL